jgi:NaMN:DMB phosphoribosyltransferase
MTWINFIIFNAVAPLPELHQISDAGAGENLMQLTPTRDAELIACGRANTTLGGLLSGSPVAGSQSVTPAILVHGVLSALQQRGFKIRLHCYQLGLPQQPDFSGSVLDDIVCHYCDVGDEAALIRKQLLPELARQAQAGEEHIIAECGIGGTTFATLWLRHWLDKTLTLAGSTKDPAKLAMKELALTQLMQQCAPLPRDVNLFLQNHHASDPVQRALCALLMTPCEDNTALALKLAGGMMFVAPLLVVGPDAIAHALQMATTRWVLDCPDAQRVLAQLPPAYTVTASTTDFSLSSYHALHLYEQGFVVEGCGLGGSLVLAEQLGLSQQQIIASLDAAVKPWL